MKIVDSLGMSRIDAEVQERYGIPGLILMENAGMRAFETFEAEMERGRRSVKRLVFIAGGGNNGGDACVMARQAFFTNRYEVSIVLVKDKGVEAQSLHRRSAALLGIPVYSWPSDPKGAEAALKAAEVVFDGISGIGLSGALRIPEYIDFLNGLSCLRVAIDVPSGLRDGYLPGEPCFRADLTLTMVLPKLCFYSPAGRLYCGDIRVIHAGFPDPLTKDPAIPGELITPADIPSLLPRFPKDAYKNTRGHLAVFAGAEGTTGAAVLSAAAAGRSMTGLVSLYIDRELYAQTAPRLSSVMVKPLDRDAAFDAGRFSAVLAGPGWGREGREALLKSLIDSSLPGVVDADGIDALKALAMKLKGMWIMTPHIGEFSRFTGLPKDAVLADPVSASLGCARETEAVIVLKSHLTYIASPEGRYAVFDGMNPASGTGGSGDILAGCIAGFLSCGLSPWDAARLGVLVHGKAAALCFAERGWFLAEDLLPYLSRIASGREDGG